MNFYALLGIPADADEEAIRSAYRILARRYHPDSGAGSSAEKFRQVAEAYETLSDPRRRQVYDHSLQQVRPLAIVPVEPMIMMAHPEPVYREQRHVFERSARAPHLTAFRSSDTLDQVFAELIRALEDDLYFGPIRPW